ncbi:S8 family serine peptidase [Ruminococcus albus]|uniref:S8 family serine peptidase n=1 Tax=Ruminococcus albus TaxID=1264 RepID=UPI0004638FB2|nr:S8 family serine peptidase [Ruminococcus albus]
MKNKLALKVLSAVTSFALVFSTSGALPNKILEKDNAIQASAASIDNITLSGYCWHDIYYLMKNESAKDDKYGFLEGNSNYSDEGFSNAKVKLVNKKTNSVINTYTDENGYYKFENVSASNLANYSIELEYNGLNYTTSPTNYDFNSASFNSTSKADEDINRRNVINRMGLNITSGKLSDDNYTISASISGDFISNYYKQLSNNEKTNVNNIDYLNIGLYDRARPNLSLYNVIYAVELIDDGDKYVFNYNQKLSNGDDESLPYSVDFDNDYRDPITKREVIKLTNDNSSEINVIYRIRCGNYSSSLYSKINSLNLFYPNNLELEGLYFASEDSSENIGDKIEYHSDNINNPLIELLNGYICKKVVFDDPICLGYRTQLSVGQFKNIYVKYRVKSALEDILGQDLGIKVYSEIGSYSVYSDNNFAVPYLGYDYDSTPNNFIDGINTEDDDDGAGGFKVLLRTELHDNGEPDNHKYSPIIKKEPTCTEAGIRKYKCKCGDSYTEEIPKLGHDLTTKVVEPTYTERGYTLHSCTRCDYSYKDNYTDVLGSNISGDILYDEEYGRWYVIDDKGNKMPLTCNYDPDIDAWYAPNGKKVNVLYCDDVNYPNHEFPDRVAYIVLPNGEAMLLKNYGYYNTIYETIDGYKVSAIGNNFDVPWANDGNYGLIDPNNENSGRKITIPDYVTYCGPSSMATWGLDELQLSNNLLCIENSAFMVYDGTLMNNTTLNDLKLNDGLKYIGDKAFFGYGALTSVRIPSSVAHIGDYAFGYCTDIEKLQEDMETHIDDESFDWRSSKKYYKKIEDFTIYGYKGTEAENYANKNDFKFIALDKEVSNPKTYIRGDVNSDKKLNVTDITKIAAHIKGKKLLDDNAKIIADVNNDGKINVTDITKIAAHIKGKKLLDLSEIPFSDEEDIGEIFFSPVDSDHIATANDGVSMYADNEILVVAADGVTKNQIENLAKQYDAEIVGYIEKTGDYQWKLNSGDPNVVVVELRNNDLLVEVELNYISEVETENYNVGNRWNSDPHGGTELNQNNAEWWGINRIKAPAAWRIMEENNPVPVKVGLIDGGFNEKHNDLDFAENGIFYQNGKNGTQLFSEWRNQTVTKDGIQYDKTFYYTYHGSHVAGTMAANGQNENGIIGVYPYGNDRLYGVSIHGAEGNFSSDNSPTKVNDKASSMQYKVALSELIVRNVKVINYSYGWHAIKRYKNDGSLCPQIESRDKSIAITTDFLNRLLKCGYDFVIVCAAGNDSNNNQTLRNNVDHLESEYSSVFAGITDPEIKARIIVVGSIDNNNRISDFSDAGERVDIFAPGRDIWSTWSEYDRNGNIITNQYNEIDGTSMASPHIAGVAANVWSMNNSLTGKQVKTIVCNSALKDENGHILEAYTSPNHYIKWICDCEEAVRVAINSSNGVIEFDNGKSNGIIEGWVYNNPSGTSEHNSDWSGIPNIKIQVFEDTDGTGFWRPIDAAQTTTDSDGHFEIIIPDGTYKVTASDDDYGSQSIYNVDVYRNQVTYAEWIVFNKKFSGTVAQIPGKDPIKTLNSNSEWAWKEYDHPNYDTSSGYDKHIIIDGDNIKMDGYLEAGFKDFLFVDDKNSTRKAFELDFQRDQTSQYDSEYDWHSMYGGGFLFNTSINEEKNTISGYYILITQYGLELFEINDIALDTFRNTEYTGKLLETFSFDNRFEKHHIRIDVSENSVSLYDGEKLVIDNYKLNQRHGNGFGPITSHLSHGCEQRSYFTFSNITMQTM